MWQWIRTNFNPRPPRGGRRYRPPGELRFVQFQSTPSARRATSTHSGLNVLAPDFNPRPPRGGRPPESSAARRTARNFNPRPPRGGRRSGIKNKNIQQGISIHALREEGDAWVIYRGDFSDAFQSTPSARRATRYTRSGLCCPGISIHALREEGDRPAAKRRWICTNFNPRPPRGGRLVDAITSWEAVQFQSTPSARRATGGRNHELGGGTISIHALREEGDRPSHAGEKVHVRFQSTPSARRATAKPCLPGIFPVFQSTPSARRATPTCLLRCARMSFYFNPRPPRGGRRALSGTATPARPISIHALREEGDFHFAPDARPPKNFNPRPPRGGRRFGR